MFRFLRRLTVMEFIILFVFGFTFSLLIFVGTKPLFNLAIHLVKRLLGI